MCCARSYRGRTLGPFLPLQQPAYKFSGHATPAIAVKGVPLCSVSIAPPFLLLAPSSHPHPGLDSTCHPIVLLRGGKTKGTSRFLPVQALT